MLGGDEDAALPIALAVGGIAAQYLLGASAGGVSVGQGEQFLVHPFPFGKGVEPEASIPRIHSHHHRRGLVATQLLAKACRQRKAALGIDADCVETPEHAAPPCLEPELQEAFSPPI
jgi:hypothetical protein